MAYDLICNTLTYKRRAINLFFFFFFLKKNIYLPFFPHEYHYYYYFIILYTHLPQNLTFFFFSPNPGFLVYPQRVSRGMPPFVDITYMEIKCKLRNNLSKESFFCTYLFCILLNIFHQYFIENGQ